MGFFSWKTQDTNRSISNMYSNRPTFRVYMLDNKGNVWEENHYEGYGVFGGKDFYELLAEMNGLNTRIEGINLCFSDKPFVSPNLYEYPDNKWTNRHPIECDSQGIFY